jgi:hypothetical protein
MTECDVTIGVREQPEPSCRSHGSLFYGTHRPTNRGRSCRLWKHARGYPVHASIHHFSPRLPASSKHHQHTSQRAIIPSIPKCFPKQRRDIVDDTDRSRFSDRFRASL